MKRQAIESIHFYKHTADLLVEGRGECEVGMVGAEAWMLQQQTPCVERGAHMLARAHWADASMLAVTPNIMPS